jgi:monofunctional biosynthetic peptidoglycan transglycosylase
MGMFESLKPSRPTRNHGFAYRAGWWIGRAIVAFLVLSVGLTVLYKFVPVPVTATMLMDPNGFTKDWTSLDAIDRNMVDAAIAGEDAKFCLHSGFDEDAILTAWRRNQQGGRIRGGSTISQQTAKNVFLWQGGGYFRKGLEAWFTVLIETIWGKRRIMEVYLNVAETGIGTYGVEAGAQRYYNKGARHLPASRPPALPPLSRNPRCAR